MIGRIEQLEKDKTVTYEELDPFLKPFFLAAARDVRKREYAEDDRVNSEHTDEEILREYADNIRKSKPILSTCLSEARTYCLKYINTRDDLALMNPFRVEISYGSF